jgi:hypothetical protein
MAIPKTENWHAVENRRPGRNGARDTHCVIVAGYVEVADTDHAPRLTKAAPQGSDPSVLVLDLNVETDRNGMASVVRKLASFDTLVENGTYSRFEIRWDGASIGSGPVEDDKQAFQSSARVCAASYRQSQ